MSFIGYARVSTNEQNHGLQLDALQAAGCDVVFQDTASGSVTGRKGLTDALARCTAGDVLVVWKLDRLGRSLFGLVELVEDLKRRGIGLKVLTGQGAMVGTTRPEGRLVFGIFAALAEFERGLIRERTKAGMQSAKKRGQHIGRPRKLTAHQIAHARAVLNAQTDTRAGVAALFGVDVATLRRALNLGD
jgi:DNA invertase Pin-like site-specific DNA recombinase